MVSVKVKDGQRTRLQNFEGVVMSIKKRALILHLLLEKFPVVLEWKERFNYMAPLIDSITVKRKGDVRKS